MNAYRELKKLISDERFYSGYAKIISYQNSQLKVLSSTGEIMTIQYKGNLGGDYAILKNGDVIGFDTPVEVTI